MDELVINIKDTINSNKAIDSNDGETIRERISKGIKDKKRVVLDFRGIISILSLFLNPAIGDLYGEFTEEQVRQSLCIENFPSAYAETLKRVVDRAKEFYKNREVVSGIFDQEMIDKNEKNKKNK